MMTSHNNENRNSLRASSPFNASVKSIWAQTNVMPRSGTRRRAEAGHRSGSKVRGESESAIAHSLPLVIETLLLVHNISGWSCAFALQWATVVYVRHSEENFELFTYWEMSTVDPGPIFTLKTLRQSNMPDTNNPHIRIIPWWPSARSDSILLYILLETRALVETPSVISKFDFSDSFCPRIQCRCKTSRAGTAAEETWKTAVCFVLSGILKGRFYKKI